MAGNQNSRRREWVTGEDSRGLTAARHHVMIGMRGKTPSQAGRNFPTGPVKWWRDSGILAKMADFLWAWYMPCGQREISEKPWLDTKHPETACSFLQYTWDINGTSQKCLVVGEHSRIMNSWRNKGRGYRGSQNCVFSPKPYYFLSYWIGRYLGYIQFTKSVR